MSLKRPRRLSSKKKKPQENAQTEVLHKLGLEAFRTSPLDPASMLDISTWTLEKQTPLDPKDLPNAFLQRLWLLSPDARSPCSKPLHDVLDNANKSAEETVNGFEGESQCVVNPLDLVTAVFTSADTFLQQEMAVHMVQCQFAVPLILPSIDEEESSRFLLWPFRGVMSQWRSHFPNENRTVHVGNLASTHMPMVSCVKLGHCSVSKSQVLNNILSGLRSPSEMFLHRGMDGGQLPRRLSNGLVEIGWYLPTGDTAKDIFPVPVVISNLRGDASTHEKNLILLCQASSAVVVFCGDLREKEKQLLTACKDMASKLILIDLSNSEKNENRAVGFADQNLEDYIGLPRGSVLEGKDLSEEELANRLCDILKDLLPDNLKLVTLEAAAKLAEELGLNVDEGAVFKKAMAMAEEVLKGLDEGSCQFRKKQLPLQGALWRKLGEMEKQEIKQKKEGKEIDPQLQKEKQDILMELGSYRMTPAMKMFTDALSTTDKVARNCFLSWMKLKLQLLQTQEKHTPQDLQMNQDTDNQDGMHEDSGGVENGANDYLGDSDSFCTDSSFEEEPTEEQPVEAERQDSEQQVEAGEELEQEMHQSTEETTEPQSQQKERLESTHDPLIDGLPCMTSNDKEIQSEEITENKVCCEEQMPDLEDQNCHLETGENGIQSCQGKQFDDLELTLATANVSLSSRQQTCLDVSFEHPIGSCSQPSEPDPPLLGLEHFLREMGLIFQLTHISPGSGNQNVLRLPGLATDLLLYGIPLELMDGDAANIPIHWLGCVFAELKRRLAQEQCRTRVLTTVGVHHAKNAEVLSAIWGVKFPEGRKRSTRGLYMIVLRLPDNLRKDMECDFLLLIDVEGLCLVSSDNNTNTLIHDNEMTTVATGLSDVLLQNISSHDDTEFETNFTVMVNALLRIKEHGPIPICQILVQDEGINSVLQASQLSHVSDVVQTEAVDREANNGDNRLAKTTISIACVKGPWNNMSLYEPVDMQYSKAVLKLKQNLFGALKTCAAKSETTGLPEFMSRLCAVWDSVRAESFSIGLQNTDLALAFSLLCTKLSQWEGNFLEHMESWLMGATKKIYATKAKALDAAVQIELLNELKDESRNEVKAEMDRLRSKLETYLSQGDHQKMDTFKPMFMSTIDDLQERATEDMIHRLDTVNESHCSSTQVKNFEALLETEKDSKLHALIEKSKSTEVLFQDTELEEEFEEVWSKTLSSFDFRPSEKDDITARVTNVLKENLISHGLQKHMKKLEAVGQDQPSSFQVYDEHFGYRSRLKHMFEDNNRLQRLEAQKVASSIIEEYNQFVADKSSLPADFSDSYITELLENVDRALKEKPMEIRSAFEVDLKVYLCNAAIQDFQKLHDRYAKDREVLECITMTKSMHLGQFIYQFRKKDQCQRMAQAFTSMLVKPTVLDYIYRPLGKHIADEIQGKTQQYQSPRTFHHSLLEELINEDSFESFLEYLLSYENFRLRKIHETVVAHLSESTNLNQWRQQRLGDIVGKIAAAVSETAEGTNGALCDAKPLLERVCLTLEREGDMEVARASLDGPLFSITTEWDYFVKRLMELLAAVRLELAQEFSKNVDITQILQNLPTQPQDFLLNRVRGCDRQCPLCRAPCELVEMGHEVHRTLLHRPKAMLPHYWQSLSLSSCTKGMTEDTPGQDKDGCNIPMTCGDLSSVYQDWSTPEDSQMPSAYWRYMLARFSERFAEEFKQEPAEVPNEWRNITKEEALCSLNEAFITGQF